MLIINLEIARRFILGKQSVCTIEYLRPKMLQIIARSHDLFD